MEWHQITASNPYAAQRPVLQSPISATLQEAARKHVMGEDVYMNADSTELSRAAARIFNDLRDLPSTSPAKMSEDLHCCKLLHPHIRPVFLGPLKEYETRLNRSVKNTKQRPDFSCVVDDIPILNSEFKPLGYTPLQKKKDFVKVHLRAKKSVEQQLKAKGGPGEVSLFTNMADIVESFFMDLKFGGLYRSWPFLTTKLVIDKTSMPLMESTFAHFVALEKQVNELARNFKSRSDEFTPPLAIKFMRETPTSPQIKRLLG